METELRQRNVTVSHDTTPDEGGDEHHEHHHHHLPNQVAIIIGAVDASCDDADDGVCLTDARCLFQKQLDTMTHTESHDYFSGTTDKVGPLAVLRPEAISKFPTLDVDR